MKTESDTVDLLKKCGDCKCSKPLKDFAKLTKSHDGLQKRCRQCSSIRWKKYEISHRKNLLEYRAKYASRQRFIDRKRYERIKQDPSEYAKLLTRMLENNKRMAKKHPQQRKARLAVSSAVRCGRIVRPKICSSCEIECKPEAHHDSYEREHWLDVRWLCRKCHMEHHRKYPDQPV